MARASGGLGAPRAGRSYEIHEVAALTGLAPARLRVWERRYEVVRPRRLPNGYRTYSSAQVELLRAYARLIAAGERVGDLAAQPVEAVLARAAQREPDGSSRGALLDTLNLLDREQFESLIAQQLSLRGLRGFAEAVVLPLAQAIGELWSSGRLSVAAEHLATEVIVPTLKGGLRLTRGEAPLVVAGCLSGERHEWGVLAALSEVQERGWRICYLGPDLPASELAEAAWKLGAKVVALSAHDPAALLAALPALKELRDSLPPGTLLGAGGRGAMLQAPALRARGIRVGMEAFGASRA